MPHIPTQEPAHRAMARLLQEQTSRPTVLLHSCCGPCSSHVLDVLTRHADVVLFFYNPNLDTPEEYARRLDAQKELLAAMPLHGAVRLYAPDYDPQPFLQAAAGLEHEPEGGARCTRCFALRLQATRDAARAQGATFFASTLSVSPHKDAVRINQIGHSLADGAVLYLPSDFKKGDGYRHSVQLSQQYGLYRQHYCGCRWSRAE